ncbi:MAG: hypothetical protein ABFS56_06040 [Pseudomonadota bacterium]
MYYYLVAHLSGLVGKQNTLPTLQGGGWLSPAQNCRAAYRHYDSPDYRYANLGFRLLREI